MPRVVIPKPNKGGRPATGRDPVRAIRLSDDFLAKVDAWSSKQDDAPGRSEAIRRLVELGLIVESKGHRKSEATRQGKNQRARELAGSAIDEMTDTTVSADDQGNRRRRLIGGPEEFQSVRRDRSNRK
jgi:hypothetical protein